MRTSIASFALITQERNGIVRLLAQWNSHWGAFNFIGGHKLEQESFAECACRELREELSLQESDYVLAAPESCARLEFEAMSERTGTMSRYEFEVFRFELPEAVMARVCADAQNALLSVAEIENEVTADGRRVSATMKTILKALGPIGGMKS